MTSTSLTVEVAVAAPVWHALTYRVPPDLASLIQPLTRLTVPVRGKPRLGFALSVPEPGETKGLQPVADVLDDPSAGQAFPPELKDFFIRAAAYYQAPLGQVLAGALPSGLGSQAGAGQPGNRQLTIVAARKGNLSGQPKPNTQGAALLDLLRQEGPQSLPQLKEHWPRAKALVAKLEADGWVSLSHRPLVRDLLGRPLWPEPRPEHLTPDQDAAWAELEPALRTNSFTPFLLFGVTGSGKTELYVRACETALQAKRGALVLTPEIGLVLRLEGLLRDRLGADQVAVLHSGLSPAQRRAQWQAIASGRARVVVGARSAVFAPLADVGVICVDEEQDEAYKQEDRLRYHARDLALLRGQEQKAVVILGSATPAVTTWQRAQRGGLTFLGLPRRIKEAKLPDMEVVDMRRAGRLAGGFLSPRLRQAIRETKAAGRQAILFLNRRGYAPALLCPSCGQTVGCPACSLSLTLHRSQGRGKLVCHTCGHQRPLPEACPSCGAPGEALKPLGLATGAVAETLQELEPGLRVARLDSDTAASSAQLRAVLKQVGGHEVDVVVGTQMITKGHHFPLINLVGVLLADQALAIPDFRASERAYTLLTQVAGRAGREGGASRVIVQTYDPHHHALAAALAQDAEGFYATELAERQALGYPPFMRLLSLRLEGGDEAATAKAAGALAVRLEEARARLEPKAQLLGPAPAPIARSKGRWRFLILLKSPTASAASRILRLGRHLLGGLPPGVRLVVDVDPLNLM
jgi:primosomal protein N' (replication factor Y)